MGDLQDSVVDLGIVGGESGDEVVNQGIPSLPKVTVCNGADCLAELGLHRGRDGDHEANELCLDGDNLGGGELVVSIFVLLDIGLSKCCGERERRRGRWRGRGGEGEREMEGWREGDGDGGGERGEGKECWGGLSYSPVALYKVLEKQSAGEACCVWVGVRGDNLK